MPIQPTYPGVYVQEVSSGVKTITGVSTSVCAFVGTAKRGPINKAVNVLNYSDFERRFGGLSADSEMSYAVRQFFANGGTNAWIVRLAKNAYQASKTLKNGTPEVLLITAIDEGKAGNNIEVRIDYNTSNPASTFNLTLIYTSPDNPLDISTEKFLDLSMNSSDGRYVETMINGISQLVTVERKFNVIGTLTCGTSNSSELTGVTDLNSLIDDTHNQIRISVNGNDPVNIVLAKPAAIAGTDLSNQFQALCDSIKTQVRAAPTSSTTTALNTFDCSRYPAGTIVPNSIHMTSGEAGEKSTVRVLPGLIKDAAARLKLGTLYGGVETDAVASIRPAENHGTLTSGISLKMDLSDVFDASLSGMSLKISLDGSDPDTIVLGDATDPISDGSTFIVVASRIQAKVRALKPTNPVYNKFTCNAITSSVSTTLILSSGSQGVGSSVNVTNDSSYTLATDLLLTAGGTHHPALNIFLENGNESSFNPFEAFNIYIGSRLNRKGIFALESVDLFNLLCLPGVYDTGILMDADAYCKERRAFMIADAPQDKSKPADMITTISGTTFPKTDYGAVYYPWIRIADPLNGGKLKSCAPCGTIAGLYARTDSNRGVWKAPAGTEATLTGVQGVDYVLTDPENGTLNPLGVNCIRIFPVFGAIAWGARTLRGADQMTSEYKYIPIRRTALFIEESLYRGLKWVVFEPNDEPLWAQIRLNVGAFMHNLFIQGAFQGQNPKDAYFVKCNKETTTQNDIDLGIVNVWVGFAPLKPAEFVILHIQQIAGQIIL